MLQIHKLRCMGAANITVYKAVLAIIEHLQRANKATDSFLANAHNRMLVKKTAGHIRRYGWIEYEDFNEAYGICVERKRQKLLEDINRIKDQFAEYLRRQQEAGLPNEGLSPDTQMKQAVMETCYAYLGDDDAYQQKAFTLFLQKRMEELTENDADCSRIKSYLEDKRSRSCYEEYINCISRPVDVHLIELWIEFFRNSTGYRGLIPKEMPHVAYFSIDTDIPRFIFEEPYTHGYSEQEFRTKFIREWDITHYNPHYDDDSDQADYTDYDMELADRPQNAYLNYLAATGRFKSIQQRLSMDVRVDKNSNYKEELL